VCCRPRDVPEQAWAWSHTEPVLWYAAGTMLVIGGVALALAMVVRSRHDVDRPAEAATP
jgi:hypothetical protein